MSDAADAIRATVHRSCRLLDEERFDDYLALFAPAGRYRITSWSPDIRRELVLLDLDCDDYRNLLANVENHERMLGRFSRHLTGQLVEPADSAGRTHVDSSLLVVHTDLDGVSKLFAVGRYLDVLALDGDTARIELREVRLETRQLGPGSHVPM